MATPAANLDQAIANYAAILADVSANPKPTYTAAGRTFDWVGYQEFLLDAMERLQAAKQNIGGPFIVRAQARA